ncbi:cyclic nucleotide-binding domain-containing protein [Pseudodesulfovibrio sp. zrk46]|uniref:Crp/Fnr family transcriptional regulator n=1 Tax=Pseudodesulfovibrio sp. zrk46 TaxID=2725288 RepID=UPI001449009A|nr:cyclic nucleotide-binding domain-containing protein [Pseudodesulfovibrio sp. zrk46]QJB55094.1 cyclic nucleotide-binding domain-containing protein [Pseudodesulfovibrio sp. zrk46]
MDIVQFDPNDTALVDAIKKIPAFNPLTGPLLNEVMKTVTIRDYDKREAIINQGELDQCMFFLMKGKLSVQVDGIEVGVLDKPNAVFGEMGIVDSSPRSASVLARRPARCLALDISFFDELEGRAKLAVQAFFYKMFYEILVKRLREANERIADLDMQKAVMENMEI